MNIIDPTTQTPGSGDLAMVYSSATLEVIGDFRERIGRAISQAALESTRASGRRVVTEDDAWDLIEQIEERLKTVLPKLNDDES